MYILKVFCGREVAKIKYYNNVGEIMQADIDCYTNRGLTVEITFQDVD